jgi:hypothetical protein
VTIAAGGRIRLFTIVAVAVLVAVAATPAPASVPASAPAPTPAGGARGDGGVRVAASAAVGLAAIVPLPRLRPVTPAGQQYGYLEDVSTGQRFTPRGANYVRLTTPGVPTPTYAYHSTFEPGRYTTTEAENLMSALQRDGYNAVRVFVDQGSASDADTLGRPHGLGRGMTHDEPLYGPYMDNVADFVRRATTHGVRVLFSLDHTPSNAYYVRLIGHVDRPAANIDGRNLEYLHPSYVRAKEAYMANFVTGLEARVGPALLSTVLAYETDNEAYVVGDKAPYNRMSGTVTTLDGLTYDMADPTQRQQSADANFVVYANRMVDAVRRVDPEALVTMGAFTFGAVKKPGPQGMPIYCSTSCSSTVDYRYPARFRSLSAWSRLSFLDLHIYPADKPGINDPYTLSRNLETMEWSRIKGPVIVGEFGASKAFYGNDIRAAAYGMRDMQVDTCQRGMSGWLYWTYNAADTPTLATIYTYADQGGAINGQLAPIVRPDPCRTR